MQQALMELSDSFSTMHKTFTPESRVPGFVLNRGKLDELRRANGIETEADLARVINVNPATLYRISRGDTLPSNGFMARVKIAFPHVRMEELFTIQQLPKAS